MSDCYSEQRSVNFEVAWALISTRSCTNPIHSPIAAKWMTGSGIILNSKLTQIDQ